MNNPTAPPQLQPKIGVKLITIDRAEGLREECFESTHTSWADAERRILSIRLTSPKNGCYSKTYFRIVFQDNSQYRGRYDAGHPKTKNCTGTLGQHIREHQGFYAGIFRPRHLSVEEYADFLKRQEAANPGSQETHIEWLKTYSLTDEEAAARPEPTILESP